MPPKFAVDAHKYMEAPTSELLWATVKLIFRRHPIGGAGSPVSVANFVAMKARRSTTPLAICFNVNSQKLDKLLAGGLLLYLLRCVPKNETAAPRHNSFEQAGDAPAAGLTSGELQSVFYTSARCGYVGAARMTTTASGFVEQPFAAEYYSTGQIGWRYGRKLCSTNSS